MKLIKYKRGSMKDFGLGLILILTAVIISYMFFIEGQRPIGTGPIKWPEQQNHNSNTSNVSSNQPAQRTPQQPYSNTNSGSNVAPRPQSNLPQDPNCKARNFDGSNNR